MGVSVSPCTCEASKLSAKEREERKIIEESGQITRQQMDNEIPLEKRPLQPAELLPTRNWKQSNVAS